MFAVSTEEELGISIHSPYTGRDTRLTDGRYYDEISIHSPYTGRDRSSLRIKPNQIYFNPLSLYRERQYLAPGNYKIQEFQSTLPIQGETIS